MQWSQDRIIQYLSPPDINRLFPTFNYLNDQYMTDCYYIRLLLKKHGLDPVIFDNILIESDSVLSGSFVLQCLLWEEWSESDLDIFTRDSVLVSERFEEMGLELLDSYHNNYYGNGSSNVTNFETSTGKKIQVIQVDNINENIEQFDLEFCKNTYDGVRFRMHNKSSVFQKTSLGFDLDRQSKYQQRGFEILSVPDINQNNIGLISDKNLKHIIECFPLDQEKLNLIVQRLNPEMDPEHPIWRVRPYQNKVRELSKYYRISDGYIIGYSVSDPDQILETREGAMASAKPILNIDDLEYSPNKIIYQVRSSISSMISPTKSLSLQTDYAIMEWTSIKIILSIKYNTSSFNRKVKKYLNENHERPRKKDKIQVALKLFYYISKHMGYLLKHQDFAIKTLNKLEQFIDQDKATEFVPFRIAFRQFFNQKIEENPVRFSKIKDYLNPV